MKIRSSLSPSLPRALSPAPSPVPSSVPSPSLTRPLSRFGQTPYDPLVFPSLRGSPYRACSLAQLAVFVAVARHGSITRAAEAMCLAQPTVSLQMKKLADLAGVALLETGARGARLTEAGREFYEACVDILGRLDRLESQLHPLRAATGSEPAVMDGNGLSS